MEADFLIHTIMTRIGILSDTHGYWDERYAHYLGTCEAIFHCGDIGSLLLAERLQGIAPLYAVYGNIDDSETRHRFSETLSVTIEKARIGLIHIGGYPGRYTAAAKELISHTQPHLFLSGHSHILKVMPDRKNNLLHINPGAAGIQGWQPVRTLVRLVVDGEKLSDLEVIELSGYR